MEDENSVQVIDELEKCTQDITSAKSLEEVKDLSDAFLLAHTKKDAMRSVALSEVKDDLLDQLKKRVENKPDEMSNRDLVEFLKIVSAENDKTKDSVLNREQQVVSVTSTTVNINNGDNALNISNESRNKILALMKLLLVNPDNIIDGDAEIIDVTQESDEGE